MSLRYHEGEQAQVCFFIIQVPTYLSPEELRKGNVFFSHVPFNFLDSAAETRGVSQPGE